jgi:type VI protein secretion system component Hcp
MKIIKIIVAGTIGLAVAAIHVQPTFAETKPIRTTGPKKPGGSPTNAMHKPIIITKELDKSSPVLYNVMPKKTNSRTGK